jgi:hypothetical protein
MPPTHVREVNWSELQTDPKKVAAIADQDGGVRVIRRDGANLILTREDRVEQSEAGAVFAARAMRQLAQMMLQEDFDGFVAALIREFPWIAQLPPEDIRGFIKDFVKALLAAAELMHWQIVEQVVREWKATAAIYADPGLAKRLSTPIADDLGPVTSPADDGTEADGAEAR